MRDINIVIFLLLFSQTLFSKVTAQLDRSVIVKGSQVALTVIIYGDNIKNPNISKIAGFRILNISTESFFNSINGDVTKGKKFHYKFMPDKNSSIQPISFEVDGKIERTDKLEIIVVEPTFSKEDPFSVQISTDKKTYFLGETIKLRVKYKEDLLKDVIDRRYTEPSGEGLWLKHKSQIKERKGGTDYFIEILYFFTPQKVGEINIESAKMQIGTRVKRRDSWGFFLESAKWHEIISNQIHLEVQNSPTKLIGDFDISVEIDKKEINSGESLNLILTISGDGNLEDLEPFGINLKDGVVYDEKPTIENRIVSNSYLGTFTQKFAIILEKNSTIPPFEIRYFNSTLNKIMTKRTKPLPIIVISKKSPIQTEKLNVIRSDEVKRDAKGSSGDLNFQKAEIYILLGISFLGGILITLLFIYSPLKRFGIWRKLSALAKRDRESLKKLIPSIHKDRYILEIAEKLEKRIYRKDKSKISRREVKEAIERVE